jgi:hypothetical protein
LGSRIFGINQNPTAAPNTANITSANRIDQPKIMRRRARRTRLPPVRVFPSLSLFFFRRRFFGKPVPGMRATRPKLGASPGARENWLARTARLMSSFMKKSWGLHALSAASA